MERAWKAALDARQGKGAKAALVGKEVHGKATHNSHWLSDY